MVKGSIGFPLSYAKLEGDSDADIITIYWWDAAAGTWTPVLRIKGSTAEVQKIGDILQNLVLKTASPYVQLQGTETGARTIQIKEDGGVVKITNVTDGVDELTIDPAAVATLIRDIAVNKAVPAIRFVGTETGAKELHIRENAGVTEIYDPATGAVVMTLEAHAGRHDRGGADALDWAALSKYLNKAATAVAIGVAGSPASILKVDLEANYYNLLPKLISFTPAGLGTGESVTYHVIFYFSDGTSAEVATRSGVTAATTLTDADIDWSLVPDLTQITSVEVTAESSATSTTATSDARIVALEL